MIRNALALAAAIMLCGTTLSIAGGKCGSGVSFKVPVKPYVDIFFPPFSPNTMEVDANGRNVIDQSAPGNPRIRFVVVANTRYQIMLQPHETYQRPGVGTVVKFVNETNPSLYHGGLLFLDPHPCAFDYPPSKIGVNCDAWGVPYIVDGGKALVGAGFKGVDLWGIGGVFHVDWTLPGLPSAPAGRYKATATIVASPL